MLNSFLWNQSTIFQSDHLSPITDHQSPFTISPIAFNHFTSSPIHQTPPHLYRHLIYHSGAPQCLSDMPAQFHPSPLLFLYCFSLEVALVQPNLANCSVCGAQLEAPWQIQPVLTFSLEGASQTDGPIMLCRLIQVIQSMNNPAPSETIAQACMPRPRSNFKYPLHFQLFTFVVTSPKFHM